MQDKSVKFNPLGLFVMQTIAMWEDSSKLPEMREVRFDTAIEILRNTYPVSQMTGCACDETGPCKAHGKPTPPAPMTEKVCQECGELLSGVPNSHNCKGDWPAEQVDAARLPKCPNCGIGDYYLQMVTPNEVLCHKCNSRFSVPYLRSYAQFFRAASLKQETQPPSAQSIYDEIWRYVIPVQRGFVREKLNLLFAASSSPLETPANFSFHLAHVLDIFYFNPSIETHGCMPDETGRCVVTACACKCHFTPAPADTGAAKHQDKPLTQADQKTYDPFVDLEYIAKEIVDEDLRGHLEHVTVTLKEMLASTGDTPQPQTRFAEFDDPDHPFNKWWQEHGQFMMSGGGRREFIWACRGWIAREQLAEGVEVTGDSMHETHTPAALGKTPDAREEKEK